MILCYPADTNSKGKATWVMDAFQQYNPKAIRTNSSVHSNDTFVFWGLAGYQYSLINKCISKRTNFIFTDMPYWNRWMGNNRDSCHWRVIPNALHCNWQADYPNDRFLSLGIDVKEWKDRGDHILVCPGSDMMNHFYRQSNWLNDTINRLRTLTNRPIVVRHKPRRGKTSGPLVADKPFADDCKGAWAVVTLCSLTGVEAACMGVPVFCHPASPCAPIGNTDLTMIENPKKPDRIHWLNTLAYHQYTELEISRGLHKQILR